MDAPTKRRSRWKKPPILKEDGSQHRAQPTENDEAIFKLLSSAYEHRRPWGYSALRTNYISALMQRDHSTTIQRLDVLAAKPNNYVYLPEQPKNNFRHLIYALDENGAKHIGTKKPRHSRYFRHELMQCDIAASFELATKEHEHIKLFSWPAILSEDRFPPNTRKLPNPAYIPVADGEAIRADWDPFIIKVEGKARPYTFMPGFEADTGTEPLDATDPARSSIRKKFLDYLYVIDKRIYASHFGANTFQVPFITMDQTRMEGMIQLLEQIIRERDYPKDYARRFIFKHIPGFYDKPALPTGHMITEPWQRALHSPFSFLE